MTFAWMVKIGEFSSVLIFVLQSKLKFSQSVKIKIMKNLMQTILI